MKRGRPRHDDILTPREWQVLLLLRDGLTNEQIAEQLGITRNTTKFHIAEIFSKIGVTDREAAAAWKPDRSDQRGLGAPALLPGTRSSWLSARAVLTATSAVTLPGLIVASMAMPGLMPRLDVGGLLHRGPVATVTGHTESQPQVQIVSVTSSSFSTLVEFDIIMERPYGRDEVAVVSRAGLRFGGEGAEVTGVVISQKAMAGREGIHVAAEFASPPLAEKFVLKIDELVVVSNGGDGKAVAYGLEATARVADYPVPLPVAAPLASGTKIDTGHGWSYVIDAVESAGSSVRVTYHVEGDIAGLVDMPPLLVDGDAISVPFPSEHGVTTVVGAANDSGHAMLHFGQAGRPVNYEVTLVLVRDGAGSWEAQDLERVLPHVTEVRVDERDGYISLRLTSSVAYTGRGSPGNFAGLTDDLGNVYDLYHGSGSFPSGYSQWDFTGPLDPGASELRLTLPGYVVVEGGAGEMVVPLR